MSDATFFGRGYGILVVRCPRLKRNVHWHEITQESPEAYYRARRKLEAQGYIIEAAVIDGKPGIRGVFADIPVQMCQFHQMMIVRRYLTQRPKTPAGRELRAITRSLPAAGEKVFVALLAQWHDQWTDFLKERTYGLNARSWQYTHRRIRAAYRSLATNTPYLFTYQRYPHLRIPNTTNSIDGYFSRLKGLLNVHRGMTMQRRYRLIQEILAH